MIAETTRTEAAARIVDIWMGDDKTWRARLADSDFLESGDWLRALEEADAALSVAALSPQREDTGEGERSCTCHPDDRPAGPCRKRYAASECQAAPAEGVAAADRIAALESALRGLVDFIGDKDMRVYASDPPVRDARAALSDGGDHAR